MSRCRFVTPDTVKISISDGDWIEVKKQLNVGEQKRLEGTGVTRSITAAPSVDWAEYNIGRVCIWLTDWSFKNPDGKDVVLNVQSVRSLDVETFEEIQRALTGHVQEIEDQKKMKLSTAKASAPVADGSVATSPS